MRTKDQILNMIEEEDVEFIRLQFTDVWGNLKNIAITPDQIKRAMDNEFSIEGGALFDGLVSVDTDLYLVPDPDTFVILPWRPQQGKVAKMICDLAYEDGKLFEMSPRSVLKKVVKEAEAKGYTFAVNTECEFFLFHTDENGNPTTLTHENAGYLDVGPVDFGENARRDMVLTLEELGFKVESSHHERASAQHEIDFMQGESVDAADAVITFRFAVRSIAKRFGLCASFMPKPKADAAGSGMHTKFAMYRDGVNLFDSAENGEISDTAKYFIGGIMSHAPALCAITNPIVNSYKRILSGFEAPGNIDWAVNGKNALIKLQRCLGENKVELRFPDSSANPYLEIAVCIAAGLDGIEKKISPDSIPKKRKLPESLESAIKHMEKDELMKEALGEELTKLYIDVKKAEWKEYMIQVSEWEINRYLV
jgi:glutamine synthetase